MFVFSYSMNLQVSANCYFADFAFLSFSCRGIFSLRLGYSHMLCESSTVEDGVEGWEFR